MTDRELILLYEKWSEDFFAAGFLSPSPATVKQFREWLAFNRNEGNSRSWEAYEVEFLEEYKWQEG